MKIDFLNRKVSSNLLKSMGIVLLIMILCLLISLIFREIGFHESNIIIVFLLGVLFVSRLTEGYSGGIVSSVLGVTLFNFFFTEPYYTLQVDRSDYPITFIIMLIAAIITSTSTSLIQFKVKESKSREESIHLLYQISQSLLKAEDNNQIVHLSGTILSKTLDRNCFISLNENDTWKTPSLFSPTNISEASIEKFQKIKTYFETNPNGFIVNNGAYYIEFINGLDIKWGLIGIELDASEDFNEEQKNILKSVSYQIAIALDRDYLIGKQQKIILQTEKERLKSNLLRSISHDLRSPLTSILGATSTLIDKQSQLSEQAVHELIMIIHEDAFWLTGTVENILSMTKIDEHQVVLNTQLEVVDELIENAIMRLSRQYDILYLSVSLPNEIIELQVDRLLIGQVLINLIDNAYKYSNYKEGISLEVRRVSDYVMFSISDTGPGIQSEDLVNIFERFYTVPNANNNERRGIGLGLPICKTIIELHGGNIEASRNDFGGITIEFSLPYV